MGCGVYWQQIHELEKALGTMERFGIDPGSEAYQTLAGQRTKLMVEVGRKFPRSYNWLTFLTGESPGTIRLGHDVETGFFVKARTRPSALPIYHRVTHEEAMSILKEDMSPELHDRLFIPDTYVGE